MLAVAAITAMNVVLCCAGRINVASKHRELPQGLETPSLQAMALDAGRNNVASKHRELPQGLETPSLQANALDAGRNSVAFKPRTLAHGREALCIAQGLDTLRLQAKALDAGRMAAFAQRLAGAAQFLDAPSALGLLAVLDRMLRCALGLGLHSIEQYAATHPCP